MGNLLGLFDEPTRPTPKPSYNQQSHAIRYAHHEGLCTGNDYINKYASSAGSYGSRRVFPNREESRVISHRETPRVSIRRSTLYRTIIKEQNWPDLNANEFALVPLDANSDVYMQIKNFFLKSTKKNLVDIVSIESVRNPYTLGRFLLKKQELKILHNYIGEGEKLLFHGSKSANINEICKNNFDHRRHGNNIGHRFGQGVSFSPKSHYASHYCDKGRVKVILVVRVLYYNSCIGDGDMELPPYCNSRRKIRYDTTEKDTGEVIVKYFDDEFYPAYKIKYTVRNLQQYYQKKRCNNGF